MEDGEIISGIGLSSKNKVYLERSFKKKIY